MFKKFSISLLFLLVMSSLLGVGCLGSAEQAPLLSTNRLAALLVPDTNLELYLYAKQDRPTTIPAKIVNLSHDIKVESLSVWGLPSDGSLVFGAGLTFASASDASETYSSINSKYDGWKTLHDNKIYVVKGTGIAAESLKSAILNNNFKCYANGNILEAVAMLPWGSRTKMVAIGMAKPSDQVLKFIKDYAGKKNSERVNKILKLLNAEVVIGGFYSPYQVNVSKVMEVFEKTNFAAELDVGMLVLVKSGLPGFVVSPIVKNALKDYGFVETQTGELTLYYGSWSVPDGNTIPIIVRVEGENIFAAISGQEAYAKTLIMSIYK